MMLLDTCVLLFWTDGRQLPPAIDAAMQSSPCVMSSLSAWEIGIKYQLGKLPLGSPPDQWWPAVCQACDIEQTAFDTEQAIIASQLPAIHQDPFDRGIIASAIGQGLPLATVDPIFPELV